MNVCVSILLAFVLGALAAALLLARCAAAYWDEANKAKRELRAANRSRKIVVKFEHGDN